jgi:hypothetical protein
MARQSASPGGASQFAIGTASGSVLFFDSVTNKQLGTIPFPSSSLSISADGSVLSATAGYQHALYSTATEDLSLRIYSLPGEMLTGTIPYTSAGTFPTSVTMSESGTVLAETLAYATTCNSQVIPTGGGPPIWCGNADVLHLSPDGTLLAVPVASNIAIESTTNIYKNGSLVATVPGLASGWIDNDHLLVNNYVCRDRSCYALYVGASIYDGAGAKLTTIGSPEMKSIQPVTTISVYGPDVNEVVSTADGAVLWSSGDGLAVSGGAGAIAGSQVVFISGSLVLTQPY